MPLGATSNTRSASLRSNRTEPGTVVIPWSRYASICENAVPLAENREAKAALLKTQKMQDILQESEARRREFEELDRARDADGSDLNDLEAEVSAVVHMFCCWKCMAVSSLAPYQHVLIRSRKAKVYVS